MRKALALLSLLPRRPLEFYKRAAQILELRSDRLFSRPPVYEAIGWEKAIRDMEAHFSGVTDILGEPALRDIEEKVRQRSKNIRYESPYGLVCNADPDLARCCYLACRLLKPDTVLETGVAYGVTSAYILRALEENGHGVLHSVDLPPPGWEVSEYVGAVIPEELKGRWDLHIGFSRRILPKLLKKIETVDVFVHDSTHTYRNMRWEFETLWSRLRAGGMIVADDVQGNRAFDELRQRRPAFWRVIKEVEKPPLYGVAIK